jgi:hypothetical protein
VKKTEVYKPRGAPKFVPAEALKDKNLRVSNVNIPHAKNATWPVEKKIEAVTTWLALGNLRHTAASTGVSYGLIKEWKRMPWWKELEAEIVASRRIASATKLSKIVDKSLDVIDDRLDNGDFVYNSKSGEVHRKPVTLRDATTAANALMQRVAIIEKMNRDEAVVEATATIQEQLQNLALEFAKFNRRDNSKAQTIEFKEESDNGEFGGVETESSQPRENETLEEGMENEKSFLQETSNLFGKGEGILQTPLSKP